MLDRLISIPSSFVAPGKRHLNWRAYVFLVLLSCAFFLPGLATLPPTDRDESSFAQATKQMIETGNYVDIRLQDKPRYKKPVGIYWLQAASVRLLDTHHLNEIWAYRIPSVLGGIIAVLMTAALGALLFGPIPGLLAAIMMAGCVSLNVEARLAKTDAVLLASVLAMQYGLARAYLNKSSLRNAILFWTALGVGILIKGPIILLVLASTLLWLWFTEKKLKWFRALEPVIGIPYLLLLISPWFIAILMQSHGAFIAQSAGNDLFAKLWQGQDRGIMPPGLHALVLPIMFFPFALYALLSVFDIWENRNEKSVRFCLGWLVPTWIVFELSLTKLPHYTMPAYPAIALLTAFALANGFPRLTERESRWYLAAVIALWLTIGAGFAVVFALAPFVIDGTWNYAQIVAGIFLIITQAAALFLLLHRRAEGIIILAAGSICFLSTVFGSTLPSLEHIWISREAYQVAESIKPCEHSQIVSPSYHEPSLVFLAGTDTMLVEDGPSAAKAMLADPCRIGLIGDKDDQKFMDSFGVKHPGPISMGTIDSFAFSHGREMHLTFYVRPVKAKTP